MPALFTSIVFNQSQLEQDSAISVLFKETLTKMRHFPNYTARMIVDNPAVQMAFVGYPDYPLTVFSSPDITAAVEGKIYSISVQELKQSLLTLTSKENYIDQIKSFVAGNDGEFTVQIHDAKRGLFLYFNDALARLPTYFHQSGSQVLLAGEVKFIEPFTKSLIIDNRSVIEYLKFCYPISSQKRFEV